MARRRGGRQEIPTPASARTGGPPPWHGHSGARIELDRLAASVAARGRGRPAPGGESLRRSAVLVTLYDERGVHVLLTRRAQHLRLHRGEVSFPGGRVEPGESPIEAALREAEEEVGLAPSEVRIVGELDHLATVVSGSAIVPVVGRLDRAPSGLVANHHEVERIFSVSLEDLLHEDVFRTELWSWGSTGAERTMYFFDLHDETIWGATARMLVQLLSVAVGVADAPFDGY